MNEFIVKTQLLFDFFKNKNSIIITTQILNEDINIFDIKNSFNVYGLYFTDEENIFDWFFFKRNLKYISKVFIPDDAMVYHTKYNKGIYKSNKIILDLNNKFLIEDFEFFKKKELYMNIISNKGIMLKFINSNLQTPEMCKIAILNNGYSLKFVKHEFQTYELCKIAVKQNGLSLDFVKPEYKTYELFKLAVSNNGHSLQFIEHKFQTHELCMIAILKNNLLESNQ
jgi:hypothetical protein